MKLTALLLILGLLSCTSTKPTPVGKATLDAAPAEATPADPDLTPRQIVRLERVQNENYGVKTLMVGNADGKYVLSCHITPLPHPGIDSEVQAEGHGSQFGIYLLDSCTRAEGKPME